MENPILHANYVEEDISGKYNSCRKLVRVDYG